MYQSERNPKKRQRAPSKRSLETRTRIFDAAEELFALNGFDGGSVRDIARVADVTPALVTFHGVSKQELFEAVVERRAAVLTEDRMARLTEIRAARCTDLRALLEAFSLPLLERAREGGTGWLAYARLIAIVSADFRWRELTERCFDPAVAEFTDQIQRLFPDASRERVAAGMVFSVSAMLSLCTSDWRISALSGNTEAAPLDTARITFLIDFCAAGLRALLQD